MHHEEQYATFECFSGLLTNRSNMGSLFLTTNRDLAGIFGRTEFHSDNVSFFDFLDSRFPDFQIARFQLLVQLDELSDPNLTGGSP